MKYIITLFISLMLSSGIRAQTTVTFKTVGDSTKKARTDRGNITLGSGGLRINKPAKDRDTTDHAFEIQYGMLDLGVNSLLDNTNYLTADQLRTFVHYPIDDVLHVNRASQNKELFSLRQSKSINVNIYPVMVKARLYHSRHQQIILSTGVGLQLYNFRFTKPISYRSGPSTYVELDTISFSKNKLAFNYLTIPLMITGKTKLASNHSSTLDGTTKSSTYGNGYWLTYGVGISGGYLLSSWTKQISDQRGKEKNHDPFNFRNTNLCVNGEIGLDGYIRLYASYQITSLHDGGVLDQHPLCIGLRFLGL